MLIARNIHKLYTNGKKEMPVLKGIELSIEKGMFAAIVGPSGAGKSTLLHILGGLDKPSQGSVIFERENIYSLPDRQISKIRNTRIGFVFQFYHLLSEFNVLENVLMPALIKSQGRKVARDKFREEAVSLLERAGLGERLKHFPSQLSGGEKQRVAIVRGLINNPAMLLCDEPTGNLDSETGEGIIALIKDTAVKNQMSVILVTHNEGLAKTADKVYHLKDGILIQ